MREEILSTQDIYNGRIVHLQVHQVRLPNGGEAQRETIKHPGAVGIVALDEAQQVLLVRQYRVGADQITLEIPAGLLEKGEAAAASAQRELREETGYRAESLTSLGGIYVAPGYSDEYIHLFHATDLVHDPLAQDEDEFVQLVRLPFAEALTRIDKNEIDEAKTVTALLRVARQLSR